MRLSVTDNGKGMDGETLASVFEPFFTTKDVGKGTGMGLAGVHGIARQNGGFADAFSKPKKGSAFSVYLPRHSPEDTTADGAPTVGTESAADALTHDRGADGL